MPKKHRRKKAKRSRPVYAVKSTTVFENGGEYSEIETLYLTLEGANNRVRNECHKLADRDDPEADFEEGREEDGRIWWKSFDECGYGWEFQIEIMQLNMPGSEPVMDWGRDIGEPCPSKEDSDADSNDGVIPNINKTGWIPPEDRRW